MSKDTGRSATIHDVATRAGVSYQTVSRVVNQHASVAPATRARVQQAIAELDYRPSLMAKGLVTRRSNLIGVIAQDMNQYGPSQILQQVQSSARRLGYQIMLTTLQQVAVREVGPQDVLGAAQRLRQFGVDGLVLLTNAEARDIVQGLGQSLPFVLIDAAADVGSPTVSIDQFGGAALATRHLVSLGHRRILHISGPSGWSDAIQRQNGFASVVRVEGLPTLPVYAGDWSAHSGHAATLQALAELGNGDQSFTAVFAGNDQMALGVLAALRGSGLRVPQDISVIGFDDTPESAFYTPPLTTVNQDFALLGQRSMEELMRLIQQPSAPCRQLLFAPQLVVRSTTAAPESMPEL
ncbi:LacI family DNA-binding transcriptional regulator [Deinococcus marmoris]|uniref:LacI family DNA-binding transcriptional regulator n=1 Tax=Deinococcus marmoris TaxID=249408 RepID=UPI0004963300|nr:LacI family DNA-binding transcriptional regulator [Deinococcus marmoris]